MTLGRTVCGQGSFLFAFEGVFFFAFFFRSFFLHFLAKSAGVWYNEDDLKDKEKFYEHYI